MPSLLDVLSDGSFDTVNKKQTGDFAQKVQMYKKIVVDNYTKFHIDLNKSIAQIAEKENLNDDQIQRIIEEANNQVYLIKYNQMKQSPERDVDFDLASLIKIKEMVKSGDTKKPALNTDKVASDGSTFEKKASWEDDQGDKLNFLNCSTHEFGSLLEDKPRNRIRTLAEKLASGLKELDSEINEKTACVAESAYTIAEALIKYERHGLEYQDIFDGICKQAEMKKSDQMLIKNACEQKINQMKEYSMLRDDYEFNLSLCEPKAIPNEFSLGKHSFMKQANEMSQSNQSIPIVMTDKKAIKNVQELVDMAQSMRSDRDEIRTLSARRDDINSKSASLGIENLEKLAGAGFDSFMHSLSGANAAEKEVAFRKAEEALNAAKGTAKYQNTSSRVEGLKKNISNASIDSRMQTPRSDLRSAFENKNNVAKATDTALNEGATKGPLGKILDEKYQSSKTQVSQAKQDIKNAEKKVKAQKKRLMSDMNDELGNAEKEHNEVRKELNLDSLERDYDNSSRSYNKALRQKSSARTTAAVGTAGIAGAAYVYGKAHKKEPSYLDM